MSVRPISKGCLEDDAIGCENHLETMLKSFYLSVFLQILLSPYVETVRDFFQFSFCLSFTLSLSLSIYIYIYC